jgi:hypothetical protein
MIFIKVLFLCLSAMVLVESCWSGVEKPLRMLKTREVLEEPAQPEDIAQKFEVIEVDSKDETLEVSTTDREVETTPTDLPTTTELSEDLVPLTTEEYSTILIDNEATDSATETSTAVTTTEESLKLPTQDPMKNIIKTDNEEPEDDEYNYEDDEALHYSGGSNWTSQ